MIPRRSCNVSFHEYDLIRASFVDSFNHSKLWYGKSSFYKVKVNLVDIYVESVGWILTLDGAVLYDYIPESFDSGYLVYRIKNEFEECFREKCRINSISYELTTEFTTHRTVCTKILVPPPYDYDIKRIYELVHKFFSEFIRDPSNPTHKRNISA